MPDYQKCMMYKLICNEDPTFLYIGHTTNWNRRKAHHKHSSLNNSRKVYQQIRELGGWGDIKMVWIENFPCNNNHEGEAREQYWMDNMKSTMNSRRAFRTTDDLIKDRIINKEKKAEYDKEYCAENKEKKAEYDKEYCAENKEKKAELARKYYEKNKEEINMKFECECGGKYTRRNKSGHFKCKKHQDWLLMCHTAEVPVG